MNVDKTLFAEDSCSTIQLWTKLWAHQQAHFGYDQQKQYITNLLDLLESTRQKWLRASQEKDKLSEQSASLKRQQSNYEKALSESREENLRLNAELAAATSHVKALESELNAYRQRFDAAKEEIQNISFAHFPKQRSNSAEPVQRRTKHKRMNEDDEEMDTQTENSIPTPPKQKRLYPEVNSQSKPSTLVQRMEPSKARASEKRLANRSVSESRLSGLQENKELRQQQRAPPLSAKCTTTSILDMRVKTLNGFGIGWTRGRPVEECDHNFVPSSNLFSVAFSYCNVCTRSLGIRSLKCNDCKLQIHENCRQHSPMPCVPMVPTPQKNNAKQRPRLADLCPETEPKIPGQLIRCVVALERGFLTTVGLYRVPGCDSEVKKLKDNFNSKYVPKLDQTDPETITGYIKKFLRDLREPLIPFSSFKEFANAVANQDEIKLKYAIETLPIPNRDTLAYLCAHWQRVAMRSNENQMPLENMARVLGPTVVGTTSKLTHLQQPAAAGGSNQASLHYMEATRQVEILHALLRLDHNYWINFYNNPQLIGGGGSQQNGGTPRRGILQR